LHNLLADSPGLLQDSILLVADSLHAHFSDVIVLPGTVFLSGRVVSVSGLARILAVDTGFRLVDVGAGLRLLLISH